MAEIDNSSWDGPAAMSAAASSANPASAYKGICAGRRAGDPSKQASWALPHHKHAGDPPNANGVRNSESRLSQTQGLTNKAAAQKHLDAHMSVIQAQQKGNLFAETRGQALHDGEMPAGGARMHAFPSEFRGQVVVKNGKQFYQVEGYASVFERGYDMWDMCGPYTEIMDSRAFDQTLAAGPDVAFLTNHKGVTMARTTNGSLEVYKDSTGLGTRALLNTDRQDVRDLMSAIEDGLVDEMSFAFMLNNGQWNDDFDEFRILEADINRGDVSAVNYGANPYTSIQARTTEFIDMAQRMPLSVARAAVEKMTSRDDFYPDSNAQNVDPVATNFSGADADGNTSDSDAVTNDTGDTGINCPACNAKQSTSPQACSNCGVQNVNDPNVGEPWPTDVHGDVAALKQRPPVTRESLADLLANDLADIAEWEVVDETGTDDDGKPVKLTLNPEVELVTRAPKAVQCPSCKSFNKATAAKCSDCGKDLTNVKGHKEKAETLTDTRDPMDDNTVDGPAEYSRGPGENVECDRCGLFNDTDAVFCDQCGAHLADADFTTGRTTYKAGADEHVKCPFCMLMNAPDAHYCDQCGELLPPSAFNDEIERSAVTGEQGPELPDLNSRGSMSIQLGSDPGDSDADSDNDVSDFVAAADAALDQAVALVGDTDLSTLPPAISQALSLVASAGITLDAIMDALGIDDPDDGGDTELSAANMEMRTDDTPADEAGSEIDESISGASLALIHARLAAQDLC